MLIETGIRKQGAVFSQVVGPVARSRRAEDELRHRLAQSYKLVRAGLSKKMQATLAPFD